MLVGIGFILIAAGAIIVWALTEGHIGGDGTSHEKMIALSGLALAVIGLFMIVAGVLTDSLTGG